MYGVVTYLHVFGVFVFLLAHGASFAVAFKLRRERNLERVRALLELSTEMFGVMYGSLLAILVLGIVAGFMGSWWGHGWIWASIVLLVLLVVLMGARGSSYYGTLRQAVGMPYMEGFKIVPGVAPKSEQEIDALLNSSRAFEITAIGVIGLAALLWLMMFKPF